MSNQISASAASARENARSSDGRFGEQEHSRADAVSLAGPPPPARPDEWEDLFGDEDAVLVDNSTFDELGEARMYVESAAFGDGAVASLRYEGFPKDYADDPFAGGWQKHDHVTIDPADERGLCAVSTDATAEIDSPDEDSMEEALDRLDPGAAMRIGRVEDDFLDYQERAQDDIEKSVSDAMYWLERDAEYRIADEAIADGQDEPDTMDTTFDTDKENEFKEHLTEFATEHWDDIEEMSVTEGVERSKILSELGSAGTYSPDVFVGGDFAHSPRNVSKARGRLQEAVLKDHTISDLSPSTTASRTPSPGSRPPGQAPRPDGRGLGPRWVLSPLRRGVAP